MAPACPRMEFATLSSFGMYGHLETDNGQGHRPPAASPFSTDRPLTADGVLRDDLPLVPSAGPIRPWGNTPAAKESLSLSVCLLSGVKRTSPICSQISANDPSQMSANDPKWT